MASILARVVLGASLAAAAAIAGGGVRGAEAQPKAAPSAADKAEAGRLVDEANKAMDAKDYDKAIELNRRAHALIPHPSLLFNMAQAHRLAGRPAQAAQLYDQYLALDPNGDQAAAAHVLLDETKEAAAKEAAAKEAAAKEAAAKEAAAKEAAAASSEPSIGGSQPLPERSDAIGRPGRSLRITGLVLGGVGLASVAFGAYSGYRAMTLDRDAEEELMMGIPYAVVEAKYLSDGDAAERNQFIGYIVGGALVVGGAVTYWLGHRKDTAAQTTAWTPVVGPGYTGFAVSGSL